MIIIGQLLQRVYFLAFVFLSNSVLNYILRMDEEQWVSKVMTPASMYFL